MYFADLTPYEYSKPNEPNTFNIGWLDAEHDFSKGEVSAVAIQRLKSLAKNPVNQTRGFHFCQFCKINLNDRIKWMEEMIKIGAVSSAEIRVHRKDGRIYAAPVLICHYTEAHNYKPPQEFVEALMES